MCNRKKRLHELLLIALSIFISHLSLCLPKQPYPTYYLTEAINMKYLQQALKQIYQNKHAQLHFDQTYCNYSNNYYGDQRCITSKFEPRVIASGSHHK
jgi:hypothetical protein